MDVREVCNNFKIQIATFKNVKFRNFKGVGNWDKAILREGGWAAGWCGVRTQNHKLRLAMGDLLTLYEIWKLFRLVFYSISICLPNSFGNATKLDGSKLPYVSKSVSFTSLSFDAWTFLTHTITIYEHTPLTEAELPTTPLRRICSGYSFHASSCTSEPSRYTLIIQSVLTQVRLRVLSEAGCTVG